MDICECMATQDDQGWSVCRQCRGDIYACECELTHSIRCPEHPDADLLAAHRNAAVLARPLSVDVAN